MRLFSLANLQGEQLKRAKRLIVGLLVLFQALTIATILVATRVSTEAGLIEQARKVLVNVTYESDLHTAAFMDSTARAVASATDMFSGGVVSIDDIARTEKLFLSELDHNPEFAGMYIGTQDGSFLYVSRNPAHARYKYRTKHVDADRKRSTSWWRNVTEAKHDMTVENNDRYDPRTRPWFKKVIFDESLIWTRPYVFFTSQEPGITAAAPVRSPTGDMIGVLGIDLELEALSAFLRGLAISGSGHVFLADHDGQLIAFSGAGPQGDRLENIDTVADPVIRQALATAHGALHAGSAEDVQRFTVARETYLAAFSPFRLAGDNEWFIGSYAPEREFLGALHRNDRNNVLLGLGVLLISIILGWFLVRSAWTPVEELHDQANRDALTKVFNRHYLTRFATQAFNLSIESKKAISVAIVDIDRFKPINDKYGHAVGDEVIKAFATRLKSGSRSEDVVARYGGEEFVIVFPDADADTARAVLSRIRDDVAANPISTLAGAIQVTFSAGVCEATPGLDTYEKALHVADKALFVAKESGRDRIFLPGQLESLGSNVVPLERRARVS